MFLVEVLNSTLVMFVVCRVSMDKSIPTYMSGLCIGFVYFAVTLSTNRKIGAAVNPALSLPYSIVSADYETLPLFLTAPFIGSLLGVFLYVIVVSEISAPHVKVHSEIDNEALNGSRKEPSSLNGKLSDKDISSRLVEEDENEEMIRED